MNVAMVFRNFRGCWQAWRCWIATHLRGCQSGMELALSRTAHVAKVALSTWAAAAQKYARLRRLVAVLDRAHQRWMPEAAWRARVVEDPVLHAMFNRFVTAFEQRRVESAAARGPLPQGDAYDSLVSLIWKRQQSSVALGRLRGYPQPWQLGAWPVGAFPLLEPESPYYAQAKIRLGAVASEIETPGGRTVPDGDEGPPCSQRLLMWQSLADLLVVYYPAWRHQCGKTLQEPYGNDGASMPSTCRSPPWRPVEGRSAVSCGWEAGTLCGSERWQGALPQR